MKIAVIDMGTNTFHLMIAEVVNNIPKVVSKHRKPVKLGEKGINQNAITPEAMERAMEAILDFKSKIEKEKVTNVYAMATSAMRNAKNAHTLVAKVKEKSGIDIEVISGYREAELILEGVKTGMELDERSLIVDIGGGSVEFIIADSRQTYWMASFEIGGQRLMEMFHKNDPITQNEINHLISYLQIELSELITACNTYRPYVLVGCSGTFETLSHIYCDSIACTEKHEKELPFDFYLFNSIYTNIISKNREQRLKIEGMIPMRVDMIVVAVVLIDFILSETNIANIRVSPNALKEGVLSELTKSFGEKMIFT